MSLFGGKKKKKVEPEVTLSTILGPLKRMHYDKLADDDELVLKLIDIYKDGNSLCINFCDLSDTANNKMLAFLSGAIIALGGNIIELKSDVYVFANEDDFNNQEMRTFIQEKKA